MKVSRVFQGSFQGGSRVFERNSKVISGKFKWDLRLFKRTSNRCLRKVSKVLQGCFKEVLGVSKGRYLKQGQRVFKGSFKHLGEWVP